MNINLNDIEWLQQHYPGLRVKNEEIITGNLRFRARMRADSQVPLETAPEIEIWHQSPAIALGGRYIEDCYEIEGFFDKNSNPHFKETGGRLKAYAKKIGKPIIDLHIFPKTKELCLGHPVNIMKIINQAEGVQFFFEKLLIPYFYYHSYWQKYGKEPWLGLKHGVDGILEGLVDLRRELDDWAGIDTVLARLPDRVHSEIRQRLASGLKAKRNDMCFCGSRKKIKNCCKDRAMKGFNILVRAIKKQGVI